jgi:hypothetical protein
MSAHQNYSYQYHGFASSSLALNFSPTAAYASTTWSQYAKNYSQSKKYASKPVSTKPVTVVPKAPVTASVSVTVPVAVPVIKPVTVPVSGPALSKGEVQMKAYITGYSYWDNTPPGSMDISNGIVHNKAGGTGTYSDPITIAVGHTISGGRDTLDYPAGTKFYFPFVQKYVIVEDTCGDGNTPQNGPCHTGYQGYPWLDLYVGGDTASKSASNDCMDDLTEIHTIIKNPGPTYPVVTGALSESGCELF